MEHYECDVVIVGGAVAGAMLAINLRDSGLDVIVLERQPRIPELRRGDLLAPSTVSKLAAVGALEAFQNRGAVQLHHWLALGPELETLAEVPLAATAPAPYNYCIALPHPLLQAALSETATAGENIRFMRGGRATGLLEDDDGAAIGVTALIENRESEVRASLVVGCDGSASMIRQEAGIETQIDTYPYSYVMFTCERSPDQPGDRQTEIWGADGFCGLFPITPELVRCPVQAMPEDFNRWRKEGLAKAHEELKARFPFWDKMVLREDGVHVYKILKHHASTYVADGVLLLGDAAHCTPPYYGMGMNMSMRDAHHAAKHITQLLGANEKPTAAALAPFEKQVRNFNEYVITASWLYGQVAAAHHKTHDEVAGALQHSLALDPGAMSIIYGAYDTPPPTDDQLDDLRAGRVGKAA